MKKRKFTKRQIGIFTAGILMMILLGCVFLVQGSSANITEREGLGPFVHYNGIIFDTFETYSADTEGAVAIGGKSKLGTGWGQFDFGATAHGGYEHVAMGNYQNPNGYPTVLLNNLPEIDSKWHTVSAYGGPVVLNERLKDDYTSGNMINGTTKYADSGIVDDFFDEAYSESIRVGELFLKANTRSDATVNFDDVNKDWGAFNAKSFYNNGDYTVYQPDNISDYGDTEALTEKIAVINMKAGARVEIRGVQIPKDMGDQFDLIIFNFPDTSDVSFTSNSLMMDGSGFLTSDPRNKTVEEYAGKIIWNFPAAETIQTKWCGIVGSVLAPKADLDANGGSINGMLVSNSLKTVNGFELHAFYMRRNIYEFGKDDVTGSVELTKKDDEEGLLEGAVFELYRDDNTLLETYTTNRYGVISVDKLVKGSYYFKEVKAPDGYEIKGSGKHEFTISKEKTYIEIEAVNTPKTIDLTLKKVDEEDSNKFLEGAGFALYRSHQTTSGKLNIELVQSGLETGQDGKLEIKDLPVSYYYLVEYQAPQDYKLDQYHVYQFQVELDAVGEPVVSKFYKLNVDLGDIDLNNPDDIENDPSIEKEQVQFDAEDQVYVITNEKADKPQGGFSLVKKDEDSQETLAGVVFSLKRHDGSDYTVHIADYTTDVFGRIDVDDLDPGKYLLTENTPLEGYKKDDTKRYEFEIKADGTTAGVADVIEVSNERIKTNVKLTKTDRKTSQPLEGAEFMLFQSTQTDDGTLNLTQLGIVESDQYGKLELKDLYAGYYYLIETKAPDGYKVPAGVAYQIILSVNGESLEQKINKLTFDDPEQFDLSDLSGITNSTEGITVEELTLTNRVIENDEIVLGRVTIQKMDEDTKQPLEGAEFTLTSQEDGSKTYTLTTNELGYASIGNLPLGSYALEESKVPTGYKNDTASIKITYTDVNHEQQDYVQGTAFELKEEDSAFSFIATNKQLDTEIKFTKVDSKSGQLLEHARFSVYKSQRKSDGSLYLEKDKTNAVVSSGADGTMKLVQLQKGFYYMIETEAPYKPYKYILPTDRVIQIEVKLNGNDLATTAYLLELEAGATLAELEKGEGVSNKTPLTDNRIPNDRAPTDPKGEIILSKEDEETGDLLSGAKFELHKQQEQGQYSRVAEAVTNELGQVSFSDLEAGTYKLIETAQPEGYQSSIRYYQEGNVLDMESGIQIGTDTKLNWSVTATNKAEDIPAPVPASMTLTKTDGITNQPLGGAEFFVYESLGISALPGGGEESETVTLLFKDIVTSDDKGNITIEGVAEKNYYIAEVEAPVSYAPVVEIIQADVLSIEEQEIVEKEIYSVEVDPREITLADITMIEKGTWENRTPISSSTIENYQVVGSIALWKYVDGTDELLPGAEFTLSLLIEEGKWKEIGVYKTNASGYLHIPGLPLGTYKLEETDDWSGGYYQTVDVSVTEQIELTPLDPDVTVRVDNKKPVLEEQITFKKKIEGTDSLDGVKFNLYRSSQRENGSLLDFSLMKEFTKDDFDSEGNIILPKLSEGSYYLVETEPPKGYWLEYTYKVYQIKVVWNAETRKLESAVKEVMILDPDAYDLSNPTGIANDHNLELKDVDKEGGAYVIVNEKKPEFFGRAALLKLDEEGHTPLAGAKFRLSRQEESGEWKNLGVSTTDAFGQIAIERLKAGTYKVEEVEAPNGYENSGFSTEFVIQEDAEDKLTGPDIYVEVENKEIPGNITVEKRSYEGDDAEEAVLEGVEFSLYYWQYEPELIQAVPYLGDGEQHGISNMMFAAVPHLVAVKKTTLDNPVVFEELTQGWYTLVETGKPAGYDSSYTRYYTADGTALNDSGNEVSFEITGTGERYEYEFTAKNTPLKGDVKIIKADADSLETDSENQVLDIQTLAGVKFDLYQIMAGRGEQLISKDLVTNDQGELTIEKLPVGRYVLYETENPNPGYAADQTDYILFSIRANEESTGVIDYGDVYVANKKTVTSIDLNIRKIREDREDELLEGAVFYLYKIEDLDGTKTETLVYSGIRTGEDGTAEIKEITEGDYILREMQAPSGFETAEGSDRDILFAVVEKDGILKVESDAAEFAYEEAGNAWMTVKNTYVDYLPDVSLVKRDKDTEEVLQGAKFDVYYAGTELEEGSLDDTGRYNLYTSVASDSIGELIFPHMQEGYYYMIETQTPEGYEIITDTGSGNGLYFFHIAYVDGKLVMNLNNRTYREGEDNEEIRIYNQKEDPEETPTPEPPEETPTPEPPEETPAPTPKPTATPKLTPTPDPKPTAGAKPTPTPKAVKPVAKDKVAAPKTGDFSNAVYLWAALGGGALLILLVAFKKRNRAKGNK